MILLLVALHYFGRSFLDFLPCHPPCSQKGEGGGAHLLLCALANSSL